MQCSCGGVVRTKTQPKVRQKKVISIAELDVCTSCGRNGGTLRMYLVNAQGYKTRRLR